MCYTVAILEPGEGPPSLSQDPIVSRSGVTLSHLSTWHGSERGGFLPPPPALLLLY